MMFIIFLITGPVKRHQEPVRVLVGKAARPDPDDSLVQLSASWLHPLAVVGKAATNGTTRRFVPSIPRRTKGSRLASISHAVIFLEMGGPWLDRSKKLSYGPRRSVDRSGGHCGSALHRNNDWMRNTTMRTGKKRVSVSSLAA
jgi:hypothetical protein